MTASGWSGGPPSSRSKEVSLLRSGSPPCPAWAGRDRLYRDIPFMIRRNVRDIAGSEICGWRILGERVCGSWSAPAVVCTDCWFGVSGLTVAYSRQDAGRWALPVPPAAGPETDTLHVDQVHVMHSTTGWNAGGKVVSRRYVYRSPGTTHRRTAHRPHNSGPSRAVQPRRPQRMGSDCGKPPSDLCAQGSLTGR